MTWIRQDVSDSWSGTLTEAIRLTESGQERVTKSGETRLSLISRQSGASWRDTSDAPGTWSKQ